MTPEQQEHHADVTDKMSDAWEEQQLWSEVLENMRTGANTEVTSKLLQRFGIDIREMFKKDIEQLKDIKTGDFDIKTVADWIDRPHNLALGHRELSPLFNNHMWRSSKLSNYERYTIAMIVTAIAKATGKHPLDIVDWQKEVADMS